MSKGIPAGFTGKSELLQPMESLKLTRKQEPAAPVFIRKLRKAAVGTGCDIRLRVSVSGHPSPSLAWSHGDVLLPPSEAQDAGGLWIRDCRTSDAGLYACTATNEHGEASCSAVLAVMDLGDDSETTEDETTEPQMEPKEGPGRHQDKAGRRGAPGDGGRMMDYNPSDPSDRRATLPGSYDPVVERELRALGSRPPGSHPDPTNPASLEPPKQDQDRAGPPESHGVTSVTMTPKLARAGPKIFEKVRAFEERRASVDLPGGPAPLESAEGGRTPQGAAQKRGAFKQRASSLEDKTNYSQRVQNYQSKFAEELQRIKKLVGKPSLKKAFSTEQLSQRDRISAGKLEPIPPQVVRKLEARERALEGRNAPEERGGGGGGGEDPGNATKDETTQSDPLGRPADRGKGKISVAMETAPAHQLPGQPLPTATRTSHTRDKDALDKVSSSSTDSSKIRSLSPTGKRASQPSGRDSGPQCPAKPPRLTPSPTPSISPLLKRRKAEGPKLSIPTILVEDEPMEKGGSRKREARVRKSRNRCSGQAEGSSSDDSSQSDEEPAEGPSFEWRPEDTVAPQGAEVTLRCVIRGRPHPTVTWRKNTVAIRSDAFHAVKSEGDRHSLVIREMRPSNAGSYCITAVNAAGRASCGATLYIQSEPAGTQRGKAAGPPEVQSEEDHLSPQKEEEEEEAMEVGESPCAGKRVHFKEPPSFQVAPSDQWVPEAQDIIIPHRAAGAPAALGIIRELEDVEVRAGESATFQCSVTGPPDVDVDWLSNGRLIQPALLNCKMHFDGRRCRLMLNSVHEDDCGTYTCKLSTAKEETTSSANLRVAPSREPLFTRKLDVLEVIEGRTARFDCKVSGSPAPRVTWMHFETRVEESDNIRILQEGGRHSLVIAHVSGDTEGFYAAVAQNLHGKSQCTAELYMQEPRAATASHMAKLEKMPSIPEEPEVIESEVEKRTMPDFVQPLADLEVVEGKEALLRCKVAGMPYPTIAWYHHGKRIESSEERKMTQHRDVHNLLIRSSFHAHGGVYKAVISNKVGKAACYAHLYITDIIPDPPDGPPVIEAITGKTITLTWRKPKRLDPSYGTEAGALLYVVQQQPLGSIQWAVAASSLRGTSHTVTSLSKGVRYAFRVLSSTGKTLSKPSASTDLVQLLDRGPYLRKTPVILDKPDIVYVVENQPASVTITLNHVHAVVTWKRRGVVLANKPGAYELTMPDDDQHTLKLQRVRATDVGQLVVTASNQFGSDLCTLQLAMAVSPKFETIMEDVDVQVGETSRLAVAVQGKPDPDILWYKDDMLLSESSHFTFVYDDPEFSLVVLNARAEHSGVYTCTAKNLAGSNSCKAELTVHTERREAEEPMEDEGTILRKMRRLSDYYDMHKEIGRGAFSYVKRVTLKKTKTEFAAKFVSARGKRKSSALRELELLSELDSERILYFHDAFEKKSVVVLITELCHEELLERLAKKTTVMEQEIRSSVQQILEGLRYLHHKNIAHLDIKPENLLMASASTFHVRICDFGCAVKLEVPEGHYHKYGTPEYVAPEVVNQTPVSMATDIWPVGVIAFLCLTGVSPFAGENDRATALNIRNYNVAFEESMFSDLCKEAKGFVIKLLVVDRLRPSAIECLRHPWFKSPTNKSIGTAMLKQVLSRRKWQRSLINYKSKMVMRSIPELLNDSSSHVSIAIARHLKEGSPPPSSSSDSDADVDELPFIPMPLSMVFSGSRVSLNEIPGDDEATGVVRKGSRENNVDPEGGKGLKNEEEGSEGGTTKRAPLKKGSSVEAEEAPTKARRATMRRGSSADSALLLHVEEEEGSGNRESGTSTQTLKKAVSMELPNRSPSPGGAQLSQEDYALKLELMRQRLLRGGNADKKMSGLRGPLFETLGMEDGRQTGSLDRNLRRSRAGQSTLTRAASSESPGEDTPKTKVFRKSTSFTQEDSEPAPLHRRFGAPLEIPSEGRKLQEATSMSALTEQTALESPTERNSFVLPERGRPDQPPKQKKVEEEEDLGGGAEKWTKMGEKSDGRSPSVITPIIVIQGDDEDEGKENQVLHIDETTIKGQKEKPQNSDEYAKSSDSTSPEHPAVFAKVATSDRAPGPSSSSPEPPAIPRHPVLRTDIKDIDSEEVFEARFKKRESSLTRGLRKLTRNKSEEKSPVLSRKAAEGGEEVYRPGPRGAPLEVVSKRPPEKSKSVQDLRVEDPETGLGLIGRFSLRGKRSTSTEKKAEKPKEEKQEAAANKRVSWAIGRSKSLDTKELISAKKQLEERKADESAVSAMRRKFESKVVGISAKIRTQSEERKEKDPEKGPKEPSLKDLRKVTDSPVLEMRQKFENKVAGMTSKFRSQSEERKGDGEGGRSTPLFTRHRHSQSEGRGLTGMGIPENQLAKQTGTAASKESVDSTSSVQSEKASESERRSRWDRWGLTRSRKEKTPSQSSLSKEDGLTKSQQFVRSASDFAPVFHIKLRDHVLLEGEPVTLSCLPAGSPHPQITWMKDKKPLGEDGISLVSHPDGRQLLMIVKSSHRDAGVYECVATNPIATITTSCTLSIACIPKQPGTPEVPQTYNNTALVLWKPADTKPPCSYTLERKTEGDSNWSTVATGIADCYYNVTDLPPGGAFRFRVCCVNKAGRGPYSTGSALISLDPTAGGASPVVVVVKTVPTPHEPVVAPSLMAPASKPAPNSVSSDSSVSPSPKDTAPPAGASPESTVVTPQLKFSLPSSRLSANSTLPSAGETIENTPKIPSSAPVKPSPPFVLPKPQSPINVVTPMTQVLPLVPAPLSPTKPAVASVPTYVPASTARMAPEPVSFTPQVLETSSLSPIGDGAGRGTPSGRLAGVLRQGVPQKPYTFLDEKARGRFGVVRECRENSTGKIYMAKIIPYVQENKQDVLKEYEILKSLHNEKVMALHEAYVTPRYLVLVAEYCTGKELLHSIIDRFRYSEDDVVGYLVQILQGVEYLHNRRVLHLDLKPDNIMVTSLNAIKIVDFGSAQSFNPLSLRHRDSGAGTLEYMAPEMVKGEVLGPPADIWTVGVVVHIMLSGRLPFEDKDPQRVESKILMAKFDSTKLYPNVSQSASTFLKKMLSSYPWARPTTRDCFTHAWLQDSYLMKLRRQTLTFTSGRLKEFLVEQQRRRSEDATKHKVLLRSYQSSPGSSPHVPSPK